MLANLDLLDAFNAKLFPLASSILFCITNSRTALRFHLDSAGAGTRGPTQSGWTINWRPSAGPGQHGFGCSRVLNRISLVLERRKSVLKSWYRRSILRRGMNTMREDSNSMACLTKHLRCRCCVICCRSDRCPPLAPPFGNWTRLSPDPSCLTR